MTKRGRKALIQSKENIFGSLEDYEVGHSWKTREELSESGIHRPKSACLHAGVAGVYSIIINSRYRGQDNGYAVTYTGPCLRSLSNGNNGAYNDSLIKNYNSNIPIRVIRGAHKESPFAPLSGYRYDGLYLVDKYWKINYKIVYYFKRMNQVSPPWLRLVPRRVGSPTTEDFEDDNDISSYVSFIRCQDRPISNLNTTKKELINLEENGSLLTSHDSPKNSSEYPPEDTPTLAIENITEVQPTPLPTDEESSILPEPQISENSLSVTPTINPPTVLSMEPQFNEELVNLQPPNEGIVNPQPSSETEGQTKTLIGGMPMPFMKFESCKEEYSAGIIVYEGVTIPGQELVEVYNESVIYEEQETEVTEFVDSEEDDYQVVEEEEVDCNYLRDFSNREIVTATELVDTININSENLPEGFCDVDVEDGPKYGQTRRYLETNWQNDHPTQNASSIAIIKSDENTDEIPTEQILVSEMEIHKSDNNMISEQNIYASVEMKHDVDNDNIDDLSMKQSEAEAESTSELQIGNIVGRCFHFNANNDSESITEPREAILNQNLDMSNFTLHDLQMLELREEVSNKSIINDDEETTIDISDITNGNPTPSLDDLPDSTSNVMTENDKAMCDCNHDDCPLKTFKLFDTIGFLLKDFRSSGICKTLKNLSCWNFYKKILKAEHKGKTMLKFNEKNSNAILPGPSSDNNEEDVGLISDFHLVEDGMHTWNKVGPSDEGNASVDEESNDSNIQSYNQELVTYNNESGDENLNRHDISKFKALRIKAVEELCHALLSQIQQIKTSKEYCNALADTEDKALRDDFEKKVLKKFSRLPCFVNEKKEVILQHRKRKHNNLTVDDEIGSNQIVQEVNQPGNKVRMVQYRRNIRTEINRTRILKINQTCAPISEDKEHSNSSSEFSDEGIINTIESQVQDDCESPINQNEQEMSDIQSDISEEILDINDNSNENVHDEENVLSTTIVSESQSISKTGQNNLRLSVLSNEDEISSPVNSDADTENPELFISNLKRSSPSTIDGTCKEPHEATCSSSMADNESSKKRKSLSELLKESVPTKRSNNDSSASTSTEYPVDDNLDPMENFKGFSSKDINKTMKIKKLSNRILLNIENEIFNFKVASTSTNILNPNNNSPTAPTRPKSTRHKQKVQRYNI